MGGFAEQIGFWGYVASAIIASLAVFWMVGRIERHLPVRPRPGEVALVLALGCTGLWALASAAIGEGPIAAIAETARNLAWLAFMYQLVRTVPKRPATLTAIYVVLSVVLLVQPAIDFGRISMPPYAEIVALLSTGSAVMRMLSAVGLLVLAHNLYVLAAPGTRDSIRMPLTALAALWLFDLNLYTMSYLGGGQAPPDLLAVRGAVMLMLMPFVVLAASRTGEWRLQLSRKVAYRSLSVFAIAGYLAFMIGIAQLLQSWGGRFAQPAQTGLVVGMSVAALILLPSARFRAWFRVKIAKHFFRHRYDYRSEWMRFTDTVGRPGDGVAPFEQRIIQAVADVVDSPAGLLLVVNEGGRLQLQARFNWPTADVPSEACTAHSISFFQDSGRIVELDAMRAGDPEVEGDRVAIPQWMFDEPGAWAVVPLVHFGRLAGIVVLARPFQNRALDWEDFDLLRMVGRQVASYLAEARAHEALMEAEQFDEFNRRFAFVMHDIKNIVSQLSLVARNAERHADNPEFRADMVATLQNSVTKMNALIQRLTRYSRNSVDAVDTIDLRQLVSQVVTEKAQQHPVRLLEADRVQVRGAYGQLEQVFGHLIQNAVDASPAAEPVMVRLKSDGINACIEVLDRGKGMSAEFVRSKLFKPFVSSKPDGFGIGAFEARTLVETMKGRIDVESREGEGSRFTVRIPLAVGIAADKSDGANRDTIDEIQA